MPRYSVIGANRLKVVEVGGQNIKESPVTKIVFADMSDSQASRLKALGYIVERVDKVIMTVSPPSRAKASSIYTPDQLVNLLGIDTLRRVTKPPIYGQGRVIAIIDSGIRESHEKVRNNVLYSKNFTRDSMGDVFDHGTGVASIVAEIVPLCGILNMKVLNNKGVGSSESTVFAIEECILLKESYPGLAPLVINLSIGYPDTGNPNDIMRTACRAAFANGILVVAAAGNSGPEPGTIATPACDEYVIAVGSARPDPFTVSVDSSRGPTKEGLAKPDALMFGEDVIVASSESDTALAAKSGTSIAAPFMSGLCLLYYDSLVRFNMDGFRALREPVSGEEGLESIYRFQTALDHHLVTACVKPAGIPAGKDNDYGYGVPIGSNFAASLGSMRTSFDLSPALSGMVTVGIMSMMMKVLMR